MIHSDFEHRRSFNSKNPRNSLYAGQHQAKMPETAYMLIKIGPKSIPETAYMLVKIGPKFQKQPICWAKLGKNPRNSLYAGQLRAEIPETAYMLVKKWAKIPETAYMPVKIGPKFQKQPIC
ncbi:MAG: hypothetical protein ACRDC4_11485 [Plesiomonas sp.]